MTKWGHNKKGSKAVWTSSENSSVLVTPCVPQTPKNGRGWESQQNNYFQEGDKLWNSETGLHQLPSFVGNLKFSFSELSEENIDTWSEKFTKNFLGNFFWKFCLKIENKISFRINSMQKNIVQDKSDANARQRYWEHKGGRRGSTLHETPSFNFIGNYNSRFI